MANDSLSRRWLHHQCPQLKSHVRCPRCSGESVMKTPVSLLPELNSYSRRWLNQEASMIKSSFMSTSGMSPSELNDTAYEPLHGYTTNSGDFKENSVLLRSSRDNYKVYRQHPQRVKSLWVWKSFVFIIAILLSFIVLATPENGS